MKSCTPVPPPAIQCAWCGTFKNIAGYVGVDLELVTEIRLTMNTGEVRTLRVSHGICDTCKAALPR